MKSRSTFSSLPTARCPANIGFSPRCWKRRGWFYGRKEELKRFAERKQRVLHLVAHAEKKLMKRLSVIADKEFDCRDMEEERVKGELLTANGYRVPKGAERVELENYYDPACRAARDPSG